MVIKQEHFFFILVLKIRLGKKSHESIQFTTEP
jgi:hypothetical protein